MVALLLLACQGAKGDRPDDDTGEPSLPRFDPTLLRDEDGDSYSPAQGDCDDTRADVNPGSAEYCDPVDHDCDGEAYEEGVCGEVQPLSNATWLPTDVTVWSGPYFAGDWTADGSASMLTTAHWSELPDATATLTVLPSGAAFPSFGDIDDLVYLAEPVGAGNFLIWGPAGDVDGDGLEDVLVTSTGCGSQSGAWLIPNPATGWVRGASFADSAVAWWGEGIPNACFGVAAGGGGDLDGDGYGDILVSQGYQDSNSWGNWGTEDDYGLWVLRGGGSQGGEAPDGLFLSATTEDARWQLTYDVLLGDVTGDGFGRMVVQSGAHNAGPYDLRFANPSLNGAATYEELVSGGDTLEYPDDVFWIDPARMSATWDWTGDGVIDVIVNAAGLLDVSVVARQEVNILDLAGWDGTTTGLRDREVLRVTNEWEPYTPNLDMYLEAPTADLDGDDIPDIPLRASDEGMGMKYDSGCVLASSHIAPGVNTFEDVALCYTTGDRGSQMPLIGDWDASGVPDIAFPSPDDDGFWFVPGEDLPWDDPTMW